jgi:hypothetical protein
MAVVVALLFLAVLLLALMVAALLRSHAEVLRRLDSPRSARAAADGSELDPRIAQPADGRAGDPALDVEGTTIGGERRRVALSGGGSRTLLAFLSSGCSSCRDFWDAFADGVPMPADAELVAVVKDLEVESPTKLRKLARDRVDVVMSSRAWSDYDVPVAPYFVFVDGERGEIHSEGAATRWEQVESLLSDAIAETPPQALRVTAFDPTVFDSHPDRIRAADEALAAAGIEPDDPSFYEYQPPAVEPPSADA